MDNEKYADFISYYKDNIQNEESFRAFFHLNREYDNENARLDLQAGKRIETLSLKASDSGQHKTIDVKAAKAAVREEYKGKADETARAYGFKGKSFDEHLKVEEHQTASPQQKGKEPASHPTPQLQPEVKQPEKPSNDREIKRQAFLQQMNQITARNRLLDKERDR